MKFYGIESKSKFFVQRTAGLPTHGGASSEGRVIYNTVDQHIYVATESTWKKCTVTEDLFVSGTKLIFTLYPLPTGWTMSAAQHDRMLVLVAAPWAVGVMGGAWTIWGLQQSGNHNHGGMTGAPVDGPTIYVGTSDLRGEGSEPNHYHPISTNGIHQHTQDGTWRPLQVRSCIGEKN